MYYFSFLMAIGFTLMTFNLVSSYLGRAFIAIRDNEIAAEATGVRLPRYKLLSFSVSSFYTGIHGAMYGLFLGFLEAGSEVIVLLVHHGRFLTHQMNMSFMQVIEAVEC